MPNLTNPETVSVDAEQSKVRVGRIVLATFMLLMIFFQIDHDFSFAGTQAEDMKEENIKDDFVEEIETGDSLRKLYLIGFACFGVVVTLKTPERALNISSTTLMLFLLLFAWATVSCLWSGDPGLTIKRVIVAACVIIGSAGLARWLSPRELILTALITMTAFVTMSLAVDTLAGGRPWESSHRFAGTLHPNNQAAYCSVISLAAFCLPVAASRRWITWGLIAYGMGTLYLTQSRTSFIALLVAMLMVFFLRLESRIRWIALLGFISFISLGVIAYSGISVGDRASILDTVLMGRTEQASSLTGRVPLWEELATFYARRPLTGFGYEAFWTPDRIDAIAKSQQWTMQSAHNAYFEITLQLGLIGLLLVIFLTISTINSTQKAYERTRDTGYAFLYGLIFFSVANSFLESHAVKFKYPTTILLISALMVILYLPYSEDEQATALEPNTETS